MQVGRLESMSEGMFVLIIEAPVGFFDLATGYRHVKHVNGSLDPDESAALHSASSIFLLNSSVHTCKNTCTNLRISLSPSKQEGQFLA